MTDSESQLLKAAKDVCFWLLNSGTESSIPPKVWDAMQDAIAAEDVRQMTHERTKAALGMALAQRDHDYKTGV